MARGEENPYLPELRSGVYHSFLIKAYPRCDEYDNLFFILPHPRYGSMVRLITPGVIIGITDLHSYYSIVTIL